jgi:AbrB family looped-hinge helix DNA binding protein
MVKVVVYNSQYRITIPKELAEAKGWKPGTRLRFVELPDNTIILKCLEEGKEKPDEK